MDVVDGVSNGDGGVGFDIGGYANVDVVVNVSDVVDGNGTDVGAG